MIAKQCYTVGIYCRLSLDDDNAGESLSITTQKQVLEKYVKEQGWVIGKVYTDDGYSGVNFERPDFKRMIDDIEYGRINCVITKDLSRLGRNYVQAGFYTEVFFPEHDVRYIALNDGYDSLKGDNDLAPFRNIINEWFSRDQSKKLKQAFHNKAMNGKTLASYPPYGYMYDGDDKTKYVIDPECAPVVRQIYDWSIHGMGITMIARELYKRKIPCPSYVIYQRHGVFASIHENKPEDRKYCWEIQQIRKMLKWEVYLGKLVQGTKTSRSYKDKRMVKKPKEEWIVFDNAHEPIVTQEEFDLVQSKLASRKRPGERGEVHIFAGLIKCYECHKTMRVIRRTDIRRKSEPVYTVMNCNNYVSYGSTRCTSHYMRFDYFETALRNSLRECIRNVELDEQGLIGRILEQSNFEGKEQKKLRERELARSNKRLRELDTLFSRLYEDMALGKLNERNYDLLSNKYQSEQKELLQKVEEIQAQLDENLRTEVDIRKWVALIKKYRNFTVFTREMLNELIDVIYIHAPVVTDGKKQIQIDIHYNFVGQVD